MPSLEPASVRDRGEGGFCWRAGTGRLREARFAGVIASAPNGGPTLAGTRAALAIADVAAQSR
jgi:hypothetical protein